MKLSFSTEFVDLHQKLINEGYYFKYLTRTIALMTETGIIVNRFTHEKFVELKSKLCLKITTQGNDIIWIAEK